MECHTRVEDRGVRANRNGNIVYSTTAEVLEVVARGQSSEAKGCGRMKNGGRIVGTVANRMSRGYEGEQDKQAYIYIYVRLTVGDHRTVCTAWENYGQVRVTGVMRQAKADG